MEEDFPDVRFEVVGEFDRARNPRLHRDRALRAAALLLMT
jgi:hypothetical protein